MMHKKLGFILSTLALTMALTACGGNADNENSGSAPSESVAPSGSAPAAGGEEIVIKASNWKFEQEEYTIPKDTPVTLVLENVEGAHGISIAGTDIELKNKKPQQVTLAAGTYEIECNIMCGSGHSKMKAKLVVS